MSRFSSNERPSNDKDSDKDRDEDGDAGSDRRSDSETDDDGRKANKAAVADVRVRTRQSVGVGPDKTMMAGMAGSDANGPCLSLSQS